MKEKPIVKRTDHFSDKLQTGLISKSSFTRLLIFIQRFAKSSPDFNQPASPDIL